MSFPPRIKNRKCTSTSKQWTNDKHSSDGDPENDLENTGFGAISTGLIRTVEGKCGGETGIGYSLINSRIKNQHT